MSVVQAELDFAAGAGRGQHANSRAGYRALQVSGELRGRRKACYEALKALGRATDRQIRDFLKFTDMNAVRPRLTELIDSGVVVEAGNTADAMTGKTVRVLKVAE